MKKKVCFVLIAVAALTGCRQHEQQEKTLLQQIQATEYALKAQMAQVDVARAAFYPQLTISASLGWTNLVGEIVNPGQTLLQSRLTLASDRFDLVQGEINLFKALGGGIGSK